MVAGVDGDRLGEEADGLLELARREGGVSLGLQPKDPRALGSFQSPCNPFKHIDTSGLLSRNKWSCSAFLSMCNVTEA